MVVGVVSFKPIDHSTGDSVCVVHFMPSIVVAHCLIDGKVEKTKHNHPEEDRPYEDHGEDAAPLLGA